MSFFVRPRRSLRTTTATLSISASHYLQLPPSCRAFHASAPKKLVYETIIAPAHFVIDGLHSVTGLPWAAVIPLTAILVRTCIGLPLAIYARSNTQKQWNLTPLVTAWAVQTQLATKRQKKHLGPAVVARDAAQSLRIKRREIYGRWGCGYWKSFVPSVSLLVWLPVMETIRNMVGANSGILGLLLGEKGNQAAADAASIANDTPLPADSLVANLPSDINAYYDPTFASEGALWFHDLTASDPMLLLPFMLSASMFLNLMPSRRKALNVPGAKVSDFSRRLTNVLKIMALAAGPLTLQMPAGMLIYWTTSMTTAYLQNIALDMYMPLKPPVTPCRPQAVQLQPKQRE